MVTGIVEIGRKLVEVKDRVGYRGFVEFVTDRLGWSERSGNSFVSVAEMFVAAKFAVGDLTIDASSLYLIAAPSTPAEVREVVLEKAATPEGISRAEVDALVAVAKSEAKAAATQDAMLQIEAQQKATAAAANEAARLTAQIRDHELRAAQKDKQIAELKTKVATAAQDERDKQAAQL